ncbi:hypothetical protein [Nitrospirillum amazonense]|uniref:Transmembrane anchor protein n=1 Tax=Nitrospirillum amazonense TaxID=28077 RepID=A0A560JE52_9PROT|nr:hypothetical protein [Nitrospirillum amazonense]MDG3439175.1 hypothetical protein [Nitrospirillum amazonense]TWB67604.1 hypothetical protein FBZ87_11433 [Nitrospirillum amazonense]
MASPSMDQYVVARGTLTKATAGAGVAAALILTLFVLPAERGIDLTGIGSTIGLTRMSQTERGVTAPSQAPTGIPIPNRAMIEKTTALRSDEMTLTLAPHTGAEIKAHMREGDHFIFRWEASAPVKVDMHGERVNAGDEFTSYWKEKELSAAQGDLTAPFEGTHGWYWHNRSDVPVTVTVKTVGFYGDLFRPHAE